MSKIVTEFYKANKAIRLTPDKREKFCNQITEYFGQYYEDLKSSKEDATAIFKELYPDYDNNNDRIKKIPSLYEQYKTYTSAIQRACYPSYDAILDIEGQDLRSNDLAATYKASIIYDWYLINLLDTLDECQDDWVIKGEAAATICWKEVITEIKDKQPVINIDEDGIPSVGERTINVPIETFAAVDVKRIDPHNLYFDKTQVNNWFNCRKIYRDFIPLEEVFANTSLSLTREEKKELRDLVYTNNNKVNNLYSQKIDKHTRVLGNTVEVLEFEGDFIDPDTLEVYRRVEATVIAGKYLGKFEESKKPQSSIIWACYMAKPDTGRGQSPLRIPEILNQVQNMCADLTMQSWKLNTYPTFLAPKGAFTEYIALEPGVPVEYDETMTGTTPQKLDFSNGLRGFDFSDFFQQKMENATGINQYMQGSLDGTVRTATESAYIHGGANMRMAREAHLFSHRFLYQLVRRYALFKKVYDTGEKDVRLADGKFAKVTAEVRNGNYTFIIGGSQSAVEREAETNKLFQLLGLPAFQTLMGIMDPVTASEFLKWILNRSNFRATSQIIEMMNLNGRLRQMAQQLGIQNNNYEGFRTDMMNYIGDNLPNIAQGLIDQNNLAGGNQ